MYFLVLFTVHFLKVLGITPREAAIASRVLQKMSYLLSDAHDSTYEGDYGLGSSFYCTPERMSSFSRETESSPLISKVFAFSNMPVSAVQEVVPVLVP